MSEEPDDETNVLRSVDFAERAHHLPNRAPAAARSCPSTEWAMAGRSGVAGRCELAAVRDAEAGDHERSGIDACGKQGWIGVRLAAGVFDSSMVEVSLKALIERAGECDVVVADMPFGLLDTGWRTQTSKLAPVLGPPEQRVPHPPKSAWDEAGCAAAGAAGLTIMGKRTSRQAWAPAPQTPCLPVRPSGVGEGSVDGALAGVGFSAGWSSRSASVTRAAAPVLAVPPPGPGQRPAAWEPSPIPARAVGSAWIRSASSRNWSTRRRVASSCC
jgi:hypothetical protein